MSENQLPNPNTSQVSEATGISKGAPSEWSFEEALVDAIGQLGSSGPGIPDWLDTYTVTNIGARIGGVAGFSDLLVTVQRGDGPTPQSQPTSQGQSGGHLTNCRDWYASHDHQPPGPARLQVTGTCTFPTTGYTAELQVVEPQGINPGDLLVKLVIHEPEFGGQAFTDVQVRFELETDTEYDTVTITAVESHAAGGPSIPVQDVH